MANFEFEGEINHISARQLQYIGSVLESHGFKNGKVTVKTVGKEDDNYGSNVKRFIINEDGKTFRTVAKIAVSSMRSSVNVTEVFLTEVLMYGTVLPQFADLEKNAGIPINERLRFATCYGSITEAPDEMILLEDLNVDNYTTLDRFQPLTSEYVKVVLKNLAMLHSLSYVLKTQEPDTFKFYCNKLIGALEIMGNMKDMPMALAKLEHDIIDLLDNEDDKKRMKNTVSVFVSESSKNVKIFKEKRYSAIQQGDAWTNNIMFKVEGEHVEQCCMIDYQISTQSSPVADIIYFIFNCTDHDTRSKFYHEWIDYYYTELERRLNYFGLKIHDFYPRDDFDADIRKQGITGFGQAVMVASVIMRNHHEAAEIKEAIDKANNVKDQFNLAVMGSESIKRLLDRVKGLLNTCKDLGYL